MASRGQAITVSVYAFDTGAHAPKTGDVANISLRITKDGGASAAVTNAPAEVDATNMPGWYQVLLTAAECTANVILVAGKSSTSGVVITGTPVTFEQLPTAAPAANGGLPTVDANNNVHGVQPGTGTGQLNPSGGVVPADVAKINGSSLAPDYLVAFVTGYNNGTINANLTGNVVGSVQSIAAGGIAAASFAAGAVTDTVLSTAGCNRIADHVRRRSQANVEASSYGDALTLFSEYGFIQQVQQSSASGTTLTVRKTDAATQLGTRTLTVNSAADPITGVG